MMNKTIKQAIKLLRDGEVIAIPTETVYGLAADASNEKAIKKIFQLKGRPADHPVIVHIAGIEQLSQWATDIPDIAYRLADAFWPGPLTFILKKSPHVSPLITGGQNTIGIRAPSHPFTHELLKQFNGGLAAPSANKFGEISPTLAKHVQKSFGKELPLIVDGGACDIGIESTIIDLTHDKLRILRPGIISSKEIKNTVKIDVFDQTDLSSPRVSGSLKSHYAPKTKTLLLSRPTLEIYMRDHQDTQKIAVISHSPIEHLHAHNFQLALSNNPKSYAKALYGALHECDALNNDVILIEEIPKTPEWLAVQDRIHRASEPA